ncbi:MAG: hypothetical protein P1U77_19145, partial [Rubripirellula sp.]|nr:hypothetical protein [Rubripirellula sp.]
MSSLDDGNAFRYRGLVPRTDTADQQLVPVAFNLVRRERNFWIGQVDSGLGQALKHPTASSTRRPQAPDGL